jgi:Ca2+-binding EF-hand superfamily protein
VFREIDSDGSGSLERGELLVLVQELRKRLGQDLLEAGELGQQVDKLLREFDTNRSGTIEPDEFLKMMVRRPWSAMLPGDVIDAMPQAVAETLVESKPNKDFRKELQKNAAKQAASQGVILAARKIFRSVDGDGNGKLDRQELGMLVQELRKAMGAPLLHGPAIHAEVTEMLVKFDINRDGDISFDEFLRMIVLPPWCRLLPESVQGTIHGSVMDTVSDSPAHKRERDIIFRSAALEAAAGSVLRAARNIYRELDSNGDGQLDRDELRYAISDLWQRVGDPIQSAEHLEILTENALQNFDDDHNGLISFKEFTKMLCNPPWDQLLPPDVQQKMHNSLMDTQTDSKEQRAQRDGLFREAATAAAAKGSLKTIQNLFAEVDGDGNGVINEAELECLVLMVFDRLAPAGAQISPGELRATTTGVMDKFDTNGDGVIDFDEFVNMLCVHPWNKLLPEGVQGYLENKVRRRSANPLAKRAAKETASAAVIRAARELFIEVDMDGNGWVDADELYWLIKKLQRRIGRHNQSRAQLDADVYDAMNTFDTDRNGSLNFHEFLRMITTHPWCEMLPEEVQRHLPKFVMDQGGSQPNHYSRSAQHSAPVPRALPQSRGSAQRASGNGLPQEYQQQQQQRYRDQHRYSRGAPQQNYSRSSADPRSESPHEYDYYAEADRYAIEDQQAYLGRSSQGQPYGYAAGPAYGHAVPVHPAYGYGPGPAYGYAQPAYASTFGYPYGRH